MDGISQGSPFNVDWPARAPGYCRERLRNGASRQLSGSRLQSQPSLTTSRALLSVLYIRRNQSSYPALARPVLSQSRSVSYRIVALHLGSLIILPCSPITRRLGRWVTMQREDWGGGGRGEVHTWATHQNQECSTPSSAESCCSVSLALAQPRLISI